MRRVDGGGSSHYTLTEQGASIRTAIEELGMWGARMGRVAPAVHQRSIRVIAMTLQAMLVRAGDREVLIDIEGTLDNMAFGTEDRLYTAAGADNQIIRRDGNRVKALSKAGFGLPGGVAVSSRAAMAVGQELRLSEYRRSSSFPITR